MDLAGVSEAETCRRSPSEVKDLRRDLVDLVGIEPTTSSMPWKRAPSCATGPLIQFSLSFAAASNSTPAAELN